MKYAHSILRLPVYLLLLLLLVQPACRKIDITAKHPPEFTITEAKEWWYGTFRKSAAYKELDPAALYVQLAARSNHNHADSGAAAIKKYPVWPQGKAYKVGARQVVEMPVTYPSLQIALPQAHELTPAQAARVSECSLQKLVIIRSPGGQTDVRVVTIVPRYHYAATRQFDISNNSMRQLEDDFDGWIMVRRWNEQFVNIYEAQGGRIHKTLQFRSVATAKEQKSTLANSTAEEECDYEYVTVWVKVCVSTIGVVNDVYTIFSCGEWYYEPETQIEWVCRDTYGDVDCTMSAEPYEQCMCYYYGLQCDGGGDPGEEEDGEYFANTPCAIADSLANDGGIIQALGIVRDSVNGRHERLRLLQIQDGFYHTVKDTMGMLDSLGGPDFQPIPALYDGVVHNHFNVPRSLRIFSASDVYTLGSFFITGNIGDVKTFIFALECPGDNSYDLVISNPQKFRDFIASSVTTKNINLLEGYFLQYNILPKNNDVATINEKNFLRFLKEQNVGLTLLKKDYAENEWKPLILNNSNEIEIIPCD